MTSAETQLTALFANYEAPMARLGKSLRKKLRARLPGLFEIVYFYERRRSLVISYSPTEHGYEGVCTLALDPGQAKLFFANGPRLAKSDRRKLLRGSGKSVRYVPLEAATDLARPELEALMAAALELAKVQPTPGAKGAVVLRVDQQKQRARRSSAAAPQRTFRRKSRSGRGERI